MTSTLIPDPFFVSLDTGPDPRPNTKPDPNAGDSADGRPRQGSCLGISHPDTTRQLQVPPEETALENGGLGELSLPHPVAPPGPQGRAVTLPSPTAGSAPETQALQGSGPATTGRVHSWALTCQQLRALLLKRFLLARRSRRGLFAQVRGHLLGGGKPLSICFPLYNLIQPHKPRCMPHSEHVY